MDVRRDGGDCLVPDADILRWPPPRLLGARRRPQLGRTPASEFPDMSLHYLDEGGFDPVSLHARVPVEGDLLGALETTTEARLRPQMKKWTIIV